MIRTLFHTTISTVTLSFVALALQSAPASAALIQIDATDSGSYQNNGSHTAAAPNYVTGLSGTQIRRSFFVFDLTGVYSPITAATLNLYNPSTDPHICCQGYRSPSATETFNVFDVNTSLATLTGGGAGLTSVFDDLGTGSMFGSYVASAADNGRVISIALNAAGLEALNHALGSVITFGGALGTVSGPGEQFLFGFSMTSFAGGDVRRLDLTTADVPQVPEPASLSLLALGLAGLGGRRLRQRRSSAARSSAARSHDARSAAAS
jgi:hypothetical protein